VVVLGAPQPPQPSRRHRTRPVQLNSNEIESGMNGAGVLDIDKEHKRSVIAGIVFQTNIWAIEEEGKYQQVQDVTWAVGPEVLGASPFDLPSTRQSP